MSPRSLLVVAALSLACKPPSFHVDAPASGSPYAGAGQARLDTHRPADYHQRAQADAGREQAEARRQQADAARQQAELRDGVARLEEQKLIAEVEAMRAELTARPDPILALAFAERVATLEGSAAARDGRLDMARLGSEAIVYLEQGITAEPSFDLLLALDRLAPGPEGDAAVGRVCAKVRAKIPAESVPEFVGVCLARAGGDAKKLGWPGVKADLAALKRADEARARAETAAAKLASAPAVLALTAVFAAGRCEFGDCIKHGWTLQTPAGELRVRCEFGDCLKNGWTAVLPGGGEVRSRCSFGDCMKDGWDTSFPDGTSARTRCSFGNCAKDGWETALPNGTARTRCNFGDCFKDGWETQIPDGPQIRCRCNFGKCLGDGTTCE